MRFIEQMEDVFGLLKETKDELKEWIKVMEEDGFGNEDAIEESKELISEVESLLHEIGA